MSHSQNLVRNGSFEEDSCRIWLTENLHGWYQVNSADYLHLSCQGVANSSYKKPYLGRGCVGLYNGGYSVWPGNDTVPAREYIVGELLTPMVAGERYNVSFWVKPSSVFDKPFENMSTDKIALAFIPDTSEIRLNRVPPWGMEIHLDADVENTRGVIFNYEEYTKIEGCYTADGGENYVVVGNFSPFDKTDITPLSDETIYPYSYFLIDKIEVVKFDVPLFPEDTTMCDGEKYGLYKNHALYYETYLDDQRVFDSVEIDREGFYEVSYQFGSCVESNGFEVSVEDCENCTFFIPNAFTPNNNGINDFTSIHSNCRFEIEEASIFSRWGNRVYHSLEHFEWNGRIGQKEADKGLYIYSVRLRVTNDLNNSVHEFHGGLSLLD